MPSDCKDAIDVLCIRYIIDHDIPIERLSAGLAILNTQLYLGFNRIC